jgi:hypothetical protein
MKLNFLDDAGFDWARGKRFKGPGAVSKDHFCPWLPKNIFFFKRIEKRK